jgi:hypothetical protein
MKRIKFVAFGMPDHRKWPPPAYRPVLELLERRIVFASDFGDAPLPYPTVLSMGGAEHVAVGTMLGAGRDNETDGVPSTPADGDDATGIDDEDGVTFGAVRTGALNATATVSVAGGPANLDAWIDFNGDGSWGGSGEQIADNVTVVSGSNTISFAVPSGAKDGTTYARFRLSSAGDLGVSGAAANGEVEDYAIAVKPPKPACGCFSGESIYDAANGATSVRAADLDGDGDMDVVSGSFLDDRVRWYENDGKENFMPRIIGVANGPYSVVAADVDGDGDTDILSASYYDFKIAWYQNDGSGDFTTRLVSNEAFGAKSVQAADMDGDGDLDVLSASFAEDHIAWYENDGSENFTKRTVNSIAADEATGVYATDVNGDGNMDVLSSSFYDDRIVWYANDGSQTFTPHTITSAANGATSVYATDMDGDGDTDVLATSRHTQAVFWYENNGSEIFTTHTIAFSAWPQSVYAADMDGDGDTDVLVQDAGWHRVAWYDNDGNQNFAGRTITTTADGAWDVFAADVDGDGDLDVLSASANDDNIAWYENLRLRPTSTGGLTPEALTPIIPPLPLPPPGPAVPLLPTTPISLAATVRERPAAHPLPDGRGSDNGAVALAPSLLVTAPRARLDTTHPTLVTSVPVSAWDRTAWEALPPDADPTGGGASGAARPQAEPGNERAEAEELIYRVVDDLWLLEPRSMTWAI